MTSLDNYTSRLGELKKFQRLYLYSSEHLLLQTLPKQDKTWFTYRNFYTRFVFSTGGRNTGAVTDDSVKKEAELKKSTNAFDEKHIHS